MDDTTVLDFMRYAVRYFLSTQQYYESVRTTFFQVPVTTVNVDDETSYELDFSRIGTGYQKLKYSSVLGY